jgi:O-antigen ligase
VRLVPAFLLAIALAVVLIAVDVRAEASFDAPKRLVAMLGIAAAAVAFAFVRIEPRPAWTRMQKAIVACAASGLALAAISAWLSPQRAVAIDGVRTIAVFALVPFLASAGDVWRSMSNAFLTGAAVNAIVSITQWINSVGRPVIYPESGGRGTATALIGNSGALGLVAAFGVLLVLPRLTRRAYGMWALLALLVATMLINRSATPFAVLAAGLLAHAPRLLRRRTALAAAIVMCTFAASDAAHRLDRVLTYRINPWKAAVAMIGERPLTGFGAGTYGSQYSRFADPEFANPHFVGSYAQAHNEYLQAAAELGLPAALLLAAAFALVIRGARRDPALLSILVAGAVAALTWFPLQRPETALLLLAACGHAWRDA